MLVGKPLYQKKRGEKCRYLNMIPLTLILPSLVSQEYNSAADAQANFAVELPGTLAV